MKIAIIPARGGSKRIPGKNIKMFAGKPSISYSIEAARATGIFDRIIVSTDSDEISACAQSFGAEVPFVRPAEFSDDHATTAVVVKHAVTWLMEQGVNVEYMCCIYPVVPFLRPLDLCKGYDLIVDKDVSSVISVASFSAPILRSFGIGENGSLEMLWPDNELTRTQDMPEAYHDAGQFYWLRCSSFLREERMYGSDVMPVVLPRYLVQDIDTPEDWATAEYMYEALKYRASSES